ncbi:MAG: prolyl oligopeptidase family serine peptidase [Clostridiaceae bacterium]|nr:prolyl oligopeptidase family serine peptidase [Clostridiaceae bacterium]
MKIGEINMGFKEEVLKCLGTFPEPCELNARVVSTKELDTHVLQLVQYNVEKDDRISAWLLIPKNIKGKAPAIIASHQHAGEFYLGKSEPAGLSRNKMYHYGLDLCLRGFVVLCPDHLGFEDRRPPEYQRKENPHIDGEGYERILFFKYLSYGSSLQAKYLSDLTRGVDFLESLDYVDSSRIGAIGHSLGGQETMWLTWFDKRIKAAVCSCGISQMKSIFRDNINHNFAMYSFGILNVGDIADLVCDIAPRPFMMTSGSSDYIFPMDGVMEIREKAEKKYKELGVSDHFRSVLFNGGHSFPDDVKDKAYDFLDRFLK